MNRTSRSTSDPPARGSARVPDRVPDWVPERAPHPWLEVQVYAPKRQRTTDLVTRAVDALVAEHRAPPSTTRISLSTIVARTKQLDPTGHGVSQTAILGNPGARAYYERHRTTTPTTGRTTVKPATAALNTPDVPVMPVRADRDLARVRQRYRRLSKAALVERVIAAEQAQARQHALWLAANDQLLTWQLRAEEAERRLQVRQHASRTPPHAVSSSSTVSTPKRRVPRDTPSME